MLIISKRFDSAQWYANEAEVGQAILEFLTSSRNTTGIRREDIFFTTKLRTNSDYETARRSIAHSVSQCGLGYVDLFLLHSPYGGKNLRSESWRAIEDAINGGEVRTGGVSNFSIKHLQELMTSTIRPAVNQVEIYPFNTRTEIASYCHQEGIVVEAYSPLAKAERKDHPLVVSLSKKYDCTWAQLMIRWSLQHGYVPLPKSGTRERIQSNGDVGYFDINDSDMQMLDDLDEHLCTDWDPFGTE